MGVGLEEGHDETGVREEGIVGRRGTVRER